ncbi:MAG: hypothetical protein Q7S22_06585, partial [Candidatus Micrarchaeota archaeon]|nr:hypothetical protein [Candidatus Micrarchaeota archaeon]
MDKNLILTFAVIILLFLYGCSQQIEKTVNLACCDPTDLGTVANPKCKLIGTHDPFDIKKVNSCDEQKGTCNVTIHIPKDDPGPPRVIGKDKNYLIPLCTDTV